MITEKLVQRVSLINSITTSASKELTKDKIRFYAIALGIIYTNIIINLMKKFSKSSKI